MIKIGITGGIATGKSTVADIIRSQKIPVIDADIIAREVVEPDEFAYQQIVREFGSEILNENRQLNRQKLAEIVFSSDEQLTKLNQIIQPEIFKRIEEILALFEERKTPLIFLEIPLLYENSYQKILDQVWLVYLDRDRQLKQLIKRDSISQEQAVLRIDSQMPLEDKKNLADLVIENYQSKNELKETVIKLLSEISNE